MEKKVYKCYYAGRLMCWAKACVVKEPKGIVWLGGSGGRDPETDEVPESVEAQTRIALEKIKANLEEAGSSLENIVDMTIFWVADKESPDGIQNEPRFVAAQKVISEFFEEHGMPQPPMPNTPESETYRETGKEQPLVQTLIGVSKLARKGMLIEIQCTAVIP